MIAKVVFEFVRLFFLGLRKLGNILRLTYEEYVLAFDNLHVDP